MRYCLILILSALSIGCSQPDKIENWIGITFKTYTIQKHLSPEQTIKSSQEVHTSIKDSTILLSATTPGVHEIQIWNTRSCQIDEIVHFTVTQNPEYNPEWESWEGKVQEGITDKQLDPFVQSRPDRQLKTGESFPEFILIDQNGKKIDNSYFYGKITHLNTWYFGCAPCMEEVPFLNMLKEEYSNDTNVQFISFFKDSIINQGSKILFFPPHKFSNLSIEELNEAYLNEPFTYTQVSNCDSFLIKNNMRSFPQNIIVDGNGKITYHQFGASIGDNSNLIRNLKNQIELIRCMK
ncbi:MAG: hypothetical protein Salg2KO_10820 [Salibacteraceae bacterium]